jgi:hypothetical protein
LGLASKQEGLAFGICSGKSGISQRGCEHQQVDGQRKFFALRFLCSEKQDFDNAKVFPLRVDYLVSIVSDVYMEQDQVKAIR